LNAKSKPPRESSRPVSEPGAVIPSAPAMRSAAAGWKSQEGGGARGERGWKTLAREGERGTSPKPANPFHFGGTQGMKELPQRPEDMSSLFL
jgi:hypothetical protein